MDILKSLDIALGMIVVYLTFSLGVTAFNEALAAALSSRAGWLRRGVSALLTPATPQAASRASRVKEGWGDTPVLMDRFYTSPHVSYLGQASGFKEMFAPSYIPAWSLLQGLLSTGKDLHTEVFETLAAIEKGAKALPVGSPIRTAVTAMLAQANGNLDTFRALVEAWFLGFDAQVRAWYRQKTQYVLVLLSALVAVALNLDTVALFKQLSVDAKARNALVQRALDASAQASTQPLLDFQALQQTRQALSAADEALKGVDPASPAASAARAAQAEARASHEAEQQRLGRAGAALVAELSSDGLRLGWTRAEVQSMGLGDMVLKLFGLVLSAAALSMGAPFWFDLLQKVASVRAVGLNLNERAAAAAKADTLAEAQARNKSP